MYLLSALFAPVGVLAVLGAVRSADLPLHQPAPPPGHLAAPLPGQVPALPLRDLAAPLPHHRRALLLPQGLRHLAALLAWHLAAHLLLPHLALLLLRGGALLPRHLPTRARGEDLEVTVAPLRFTEQEVGFVVEKVVFEAEEAAEEVQGPPDPPTTLPRGVVRVTVGVHDGPAPPVWHQQAALHLLHLALLLLHRGALLHCHLASRGQL